MVKKRHVHRRHTVQAEIRNFQLAKATSALTLKIYSRGRRVGELQVGRGSLFWWGAHKQNGKRLRWGQLAELLNELAYGKR